MRWLKMKSTRRTSYAGLASGMLGSLLVCWAMLCDRCSPFEACLSCPKYYESLI
jgi:hypothetical protein